MHAHDDPDDDVRDIAVDPDVDFHLEAQRHELDVHPALVLGAISAGGVLGSEARYALTVALPDRAGGIPWTTLLVNVGGCLVMGVVMVLVRGWGARFPLLRPFVAVGVLGGFTTFSAYAVGIVRLLADGRPWPALAYLALTPALAVGGVALGTVLGRVIPGLAGSPRQRRAVRRKAPA